ncbi:MAG: guanylate kinase [Pseudomonadota bacterium]
MAQRRGIPIILSSPSGAGKSTLSGLLRAWDPSISFSVSATTRAPRPGEQDGREYYFVTREAFQEMVSRGKMLEHAEVFGNFYGSPLEPVEEALSAGRDVIFDIDWQGGQQIRGSGLAQDLVTIFILPPSIKELEARLRKRGQDSDDVITRRMAQSWQEISHWAEYDYCIINRDIDESAEQLRSILSAERLRRTRQSGLVGFVRGLSEEYGERTS